MVALFDTACSMPRSSRGLHAAAKQACWSGTVLIDGIGFSGAFSSPLYYSSHQRNQLHYVVR